MLLFTIKIIYLKKTLFFIVGMIKKKTQPFIIDIVL